LLCFSQTLQVPISAVSPALGETKPLKRAARKAEIIAIGRIPARECECDAARCGGSR
jgi:hypothetical protein